MKTKILQIIVLILLVMVCVAGGILIKEIENNIPEIDYTIYDVKDHTPRLEPEVNGSFLKQIVDSFKEDNRPYKYKYYKKLEVINYCNCDQCRINWVWGEPPKWKMLTDGVSVAANPKIFAVGAHIRLGADTELIVLYNDESIPENTIYVYLKNHDRSKKAFFQGIHDVYKGS